MTFGTKKEQLTNSYQLEMYELRILLLFVAKHRDFLPEKGNNKAKKQQKSSLLTIPEKILIFVPDEGNETVKATETFEREKLEMLGRIVSRLASPRNILGEKFFEHSGYHKTSRNA